MPLIKPRKERTRFVRHITQLYAENQEELYAYAAFIEDSTAYVLNALIDTLNLSGIPTSRYGAPPIQSRVYRLPPKSGGGPRARHAA
jgi:hypothetical protein